jgi:hypothetical protein
MLSAHALKISTDLVKFESEIESNVKRKISRILNEKDYIITTRVSEKEVIKNTSKESSAEEVNPLTKFDLVDTYIEEDQKLDKSIEIGKISVQLYLNSTLSEATKTDVKNILSKTLTSIGGVDINYSYENFTKTPKAVEAVKELPFYEKFPTLTIISAFVSLFLIIILFGFSKFQKIALLAVKALEGIKLEDSGSHVSGGASSTGQAPIGEGQSVGSSEVNGINTTNRTSSTTNENHNHSDSMEVLLPSQEGLGRFESYIESDPKDAANLIRQWQMMNTSLSNATVSYVLKSLDFNLLKSFVGQFDKNEKRNIKQIISAPTTSLNIKSIDNFIVTALIDTVIEPSLIGDSDFNKSLFTANIENLVQISEDNPQLGSELLSVLPENVTAQVFDQLNEQTFAKVMSESLNFSKEKLSSNFSQIKLALDSAPTEELEEMSPILKSTEAMLNGASVEKENVIINILVKTKEKEEFQEIMINKFPSELIQDLPEEIISKTVLSMNMNICVNLLSVFSEDEKTTILDIIGPKESKIRDIYEIELSRIMRTPILLESLKAKEESLRLDYKESLRNTISKNASIVSPMLNEWIDKKYVSEGSLKIAS